MSQQTFLIGLLLTITAVCSADPVSDRNLDWQRLKRGEVIIEDATNDQGIPGLIAHFTVAASAGKIWAVLTDYEHFTEVFEGINRMRLIEGDERGARVEFWVDAIIRQLHYVLYRRYDIPQQRLSWRRVSGDLKVIEGFWEIYDVPDSQVSLLTYSSFVEVGGLVPTRLIRWGAKRKARKMALRLRTWVESGKGSHVENQTPLSLLSYYKRADP